MAVWSLPAGPKKMRKYIELWFNHYKDFGRQAYIVNVDFIE